MLRKNMNIKPFKEISIKLLRNVLNLHRFVFVYFISFGTVLWILITSLNLLKYETGIKDLLLYYGTFIAINIAFAAASFSYASVCDEKNKKDIIEIGELFFHSAVSIPVAFIFMWIKIKFEYNSDIEILNNIIIYMKNFIFIFGVMFISYAATGFCFGLSKIEKHLFLSNKYL